MPVIQTKTVEPGQQSPWCSLRCNVSPPLVHLEVRRGVVLEVVFPIEGEAEEADVELLRLVHVEDAQDGDRPLERHGHADLRGCRGTQAGVVARHDFTCRKPASSFISSCGSTGLTRWWS